MTRILIADDHEVVRSGLRAILELHEGWEIVCEAGDGREAIAKALAAKPDVAIVDYALPLINGIDAARQIRARVPEVEILILTMHDSDTLVADALASGARAFLLKSDAKQHIVAAVEALAAHAPFFTERVSEQLLGSYLSPGLQRTDAVLTPRERAVVKLIAEGRGNKEVADILNLSVKTIETHRAAAMRKLNLRSTAALVHYAIRNRLVEA